MKFLIEKRIKKVILSLMIIYLSLSSYAAIISQNDASSFITKAEFDNFKEGYNNQINDYKQNINEKIDDAIESYLDRSRALGDQTSAWQLLWTENEFLNKVHQRIDVPSPDDDLLENNEKPKVTLTWNINCLEHINESDTYLNDFGKYFTGELKHSLYNSENSWMELYYYNFKVAPRDGENVSYYELEEFYNDLMSIDEEYLVTINLSDFRDYVGNLTENPIPAIINKIDVAFNEDLEHTNIRDYCKIRYEVHILKKPSEYDLLVGSQADESWMKYVGVVPPCTLIFDYEYPGVYNWYAQKEEKLDSETYFGGNDYFGNFNDNYFSFAVANAASGTKMNIDNLEKIYQRMMNKYGTWESLHNTMDDILAYLAAPDMSKTPDDAIGILNDVFKYILYNENYVLPYKYKIKVHLTKDQYSYAAPDSYWIDRYGMVPPFNIVFESDGKKFYKWYAEDTTYPYLAYKKYSNSVVSQALPEDQASFLVEKIYEGKYNYCGYADNMTIDNRALFDYLVQYNDPNTNTMYGNKIFDLNTANIDIEQDDLPMIDIPFAMQSGTKNLLNGKFNYKMQYNPVKKLNDAYKEYDYETFTNEAIDWTGGFRICRDNDFNYDFSTYNLDFNGIKNIFYLDTFDNNENINSPAFSYDFYFRWTHDYVNQEYDSFDFYPEDIKKMALHAYPVVYAYQSENPPFWVHILNEHYNRETRELSKDMARVYFGKISFPYMYVKRYNATFDQMYSKGISRRVGHAVSLGAGIPIAKTYTAQSNSTLKFKIHLKHTGSNNEFHSDTVTTTCIISATPFINGALSSTSTFHIDNININFKDPNELFEVPGITCGENTTLWISFARPNQGLPETNRDKYAFFLSDVSIE